jgi:hypothetical protein
MRVLDDYSKNTGGRCRCQSESRTGFYTGRTIIEMAKQTINSQPGPYKDGLRWLNISARTAHIAVAGVVFGGVMLQTAHDRLAVWHYLAIASGAALLFIEWRHDPAWPHRGKGLLVHLHVLLGVLVHIAPGLAVLLLWGVVVSGSIGSHMPRRYRHWSILHGPEKREKK